MHTIEIKANTQHTILLSQLLHSLPEIDIIVHENAQLTLIHDIDNQYNTARMVRQAHHERLIVIPLALSSSKGASVHNYIITCKRNVTVNFYALITQSTNLTITANLKEQGACINIYGTYLLAEEHSINLVTKQWHQAPHTTSKVILKGLLKDAARAHYHGTILVDKQAVGTVAAQENKNILLSQQAGAISIPSLEVLTDDVQCSHGSAVGQLNQEHLIYLMTRGLSEVQAKQLLLESFLLQEWSVLPDVQQLIKQHLSTFL